MVEDEDGKIRRNLVAVSTAILVLAWLDVPLAAVAARLLGEKAEGSQYVLSPMKVWTATAALLLYFILRFRFSDEATAAFASLGQTQSERYANLFWRHLRGLAKSAEAGQLPAGELRSAIESMTARAGERQGRSDEYKARRPKVRFGLTTSAPKVGLDHNLTVMLQWHLDGQSEPNSTNSGVRYTMPATLHRKLRLLAWGYAAIYSKGSLSLIWPVSLAAAAVTVVCWKVSRSLL